MLPSVVQLPLMMTSKVLWGLVEVGMLLNLDVHNPTLDHALQLNTRPPALYKAYGS